MVPSSEQVGNDVGMMTLQSSKGLIIILRGRFTVIRITLSNTLDLPTCFNVSLFTLNKNAFQ